MTYSDLLRRYQNSISGISKDVFDQNAARLLSNFKMTRQGPFSGVKYQNGKPSDPNKKLNECWNSIGDDLIRIRNSIDMYKSPSRVRVLVNLEAEQFEGIFEELWKVFKRLLPICMGENTFGLVGASKIIFALLPEVGLPVDNKQWRSLFKTVDYGDVLRMMADEIRDWESTTRERLDSCDPRELTTLPAVYNVMAMKARP